MTEEYRQRRREKRRLAEQIALDAGVEDMPHATLVKLARRALVQRIIDQSILGRQRPDDFRRDLQAWIDKP